MSKHVFMPEKTGTSHEKETSLFLGNSKMHPKKVSSSKNSLNIENKMKESAKTKHSPAKAKGELYFENVEKKTAKHSEALENWIQDETRPQEVVTFSSLSLNPVQKNGDIARKVLSASHLLEILLTLMLYHDNHRHKNDIQDKKDIFVEGNAATKAKGVGTKESFFASLQKISPEHNKDYLFASSAIHNYEKGELDSLPTQHDNAFHHPNFLVQKATNITKYEKNIKNSFSNQAKSKGKSKIDFERKEGLRLSKIPILVNTDKKGKQPNKKRERSSPFLIKINNDGLKTRFIKDKNEMRGVKTRPLGITNPSSNYNPAKTTVHSTNRSNSSLRNIISLSNKKERTALSFDEKMLQTYNTTLKNSVFDSLIQKKLHIDDIYLPNISVDGRGNKKEDNKSLDMLNIKKEPLSNSNLDFFKVQNFSEPTSTNIISFASINQTNETLVISKLGKNIALVSSNITPTELFNNIYLNPSKVVPNPQTRKLQPSILPPSNSSFVKMINFLIPLFPISQQKHKYNESLNNGKDQKQQETNDSHYHKILAERNARDNFLSGSLALMPPKKYSPTLTLPLPQIMLTDRNRNSFDHSLTEKSNFNSIKGEINQLERPTNKKKKIGQKRNIVLKFLKYAEPDKKKIPRTNSVYGWDKFNQNRTKTGFEELELLPKTIQLSEINVTSLKDVEGKAQNVYTYLLFKIPEVF